MYMSKLHRWNRISCTMKGIRTNLLIYLISFNGVSCFINDSVEYTDGDRSIKKPLFVFPKPKEEILNPFGFKISIPDQPGIQSVTFSAVVNLDMYEDIDHIRSTRFYKSLSGTNLPDEWALESDCELKFGDHVYYSVYITKDGVLYKMEHFFFGIAFYEGKIVLI